MLTCERSTCRIVNHGTYRDFGVNPRIQTVEGRDPLSWLIDQQDMVASADCGGGTSPEVEFLGEAIAEHDERRTLLRTVSGLPKVARKKLAFKRNVDDLKRDVMEGRRSPECSAIRPKGFPEPRLPRAHSDQ